MTSEEAIEILNGHTQYFVPTQDLEALEMAIDALSEQKDGKWIPVSKETPKGGSNVLVCFDFKGDRTVEMATYYSCGKFIGFNDEYLTKEGRKYRKAIAWMEKPEPYEGDKE